MTTLRDLSTRELLNAAKSAHSWSFDEDTPARIPVGRRLLAGGVVCVVEATLAEILSVLNTREHVPSKAEAKVIRQLQAKTGQSEEWIRAHPKYGQMLADVQFPNRRRISAREAARIAPLVGQRWFGRMYKVI
jgi:hypothetical protein